MQQAALYDSRVLHCMLVRHCRLSHQAPVQLEPGSNVAVAVLPYNRSDNSCERDQQRALNFLYRLCSHHEIVPGRRFTVNRIVNCAHRTGGRRPRSG